MNINEISQNPNNSKQKHDKVVVSFIHYLIHYTLVVHFIPFKENLWSLNVSDWLFNSNPVLKLKFSIFQQPLIII